ncbi:MAG: amidohydrolase family protein, partial [Bryobacteraceae bacterium]
SQTYDLVIRNARVVDPESKLDAVRNLGIANGKIARIATSNLDGRATIDATGLVAAPGFIDLHSHGQDLENDRYKAMDGVTTALELEIGVAEIDAWYARRAAGKALVHYGASIGHPPVRMALFRDPGDFLPSGPGAHRVATPEEITELKRRIEHGLNRGAPAVGFGVAYTPGASAHEILEMFRVAARFGAPCHVHTRGGGMSGLMESIAAAAITGAPLHVVHIQSSGLKSTPQLVEAIAQAHARGLDVTTECYPYGAGMTRIESSIYDDGWQQRMGGIDFKDVQWVATGERLTPESFARFRKIGGSVIHHVNTEETVRSAVAAPSVMIASDGGLRGGKGHPRSTGAYARVLGRYVREAKVASLMDAIARMSLLPAQRLEKRVPAMRNKGRIRVGADADLAIFDPNTVIDRSTYLEPALYSEGFRHVLVAGIPVVRAGKLVDGVFPGQPVRAPLK